MEKLIAIKELAKRASVHPDTIRKWEEAGYISSIRTLGGHRRYLESEADHVIHQMKCPVPLHSFETLESKAWFRKDRFINWKRFVGFHHYNQQINNRKEICKREGSEMVIKVLDVLSDEDWKSTDKIDEVLEPIYSWYRKYHEYYSESVLYNMSEGLRDGTLQAIRGGKVVTQEAIKEEENRYQEMLRRLGLKRPTPVELQDIGCQLDGVNYVLWGTIGPCGIAMGGEKSVLEGQGSFTNEPFL